MQMQDDTDTGNNEIAVVWDYGEEKKRDGGAATQRRAGTGGKQAAQGKGEKEAKAVQTSNTPGRIRARETFSGNGCAFYSP